MLLRGVQYKQMMRWAIWTFLYFWRAEGLLFQNEEWDFNFDQIPLQHFFYKNDPESVFFIAIKSFHYKIFMFSIDFSVYLSIKFSWLMNFLKVKRINASANHHHSLPQYIPSNTRKQEETLVLTLLRI